MQPTKHVSDSGFSLAQDVFDVSIARLRFQERILPILATSERGVIQLFAWDEAKGKWRGTPLLHAGIEVVRGTPSISNRWNWSRHVGLAAADGLIYVVYKRAPLSDQQEKANPGELMLAIFEMDESSRLRQKQVLPVPMPTYEQLVPGLPPQLIRAPQTPGFELWAGIEPRRNRLLVVTQTLGKKATAEGGGAELMLLSCDLDRVDQAEAWSDCRLDEGGYGLDVRMVGDTLLLAYRTQPQAVSLPLPRFPSDPLYGSAPPLELDASPESDRYFAPLILMQVELGTLQTTTLELPGGEHPRLQSTNPLLVIVDRPRLSVRVVTRVKEVQGRLEVEPQIQWNLLGVDKLALMPVEKGSPARGILLSIPDGGAPYLPRTFSPWVEAQDLFTPVSAAGFGWASTWPRFPLEVLQLDQDEKGRFLDFLHKAPQFALLRSRARLAIDFERGSFQVQELRSLVQDINHGQIRDPLTLEPDTAGENNQFAPFERLAQHTDLTFQAPAYRVDNTIGGSLVVDREGSPHQFQAYTDLGDGGVRVLYDLDLAPPGEPPVNEKPKSLEPDRVPGPGLANERWIELQADDWQAVHLPAIRASGEFSILNTITSTIHAQLEILSRAVGLPPGSDREQVVPADQINFIQSQLNEQEAQVQNAETVFSEDGAAPGAFVSYGPPVLTASADAFLTAGIGDEAVSDVRWRFRAPPTLLDPPGSGDPSVESLPVRARGNPVTVQFGRRGNWLAGVSLRGADGSRRQFRVVIPVTQDSLFRRIASLQHRLSRRSLGENLSSVGTFGLGTIVCHLLQYRLTFPVEPEELLAQSIAIRGLEGTDAQWRFRADDDRQGLIDYRLRLHLESQDVRLRGLLGTLTKVERVAVTLFYGRSFTPGILMNDTRTASPQTGVISRTSGHDNLRHGTGAVPDRVPAGISARPHGEARVWVNREDVQVEVSMLAQATAAGVKTLLIGLGATIAVQTLAGLMAALGVAAAAAALPGAGLTAFFIAVAAALAVFLFIAYQVPPIVADFIADSIKTELESEEMRIDLAQTNLLQFAGEGLSEILARHVIEQAIESGSSLEAPSAESAGEDRFRRDLFQMIHVSEGRCRVLIRDERNNSTTNELDGRQV